MAVKFYLDKRANKFGEVPIRVSISIKNTRLLSTVGYSIRPETWDPDKQRVSPAFKTVNKQNATPKNINDRLKIITSHFDLKEIKAVSKPTPKELIRELSEITGSTYRRVLDDNKPEKTVLACLNEFFIQGTTAHQWTKGTAQCWNAFKSHISQLGDNLTFEFFNEEGIQRFIDHLRSDCQMKDNTVRKHYANLKGFLHWAIRKGFCRERAIDNYTPRFRVIRQPVIFLTAEELIRLYRFQVPNNGVNVTLKRANGEEYEKTVCFASSLEKARDLFCFCCFTGLRYSDMAKLKRSDITENAISVTTQKTNDRLTIELNRFSKEILEKYKDERYPDNLALPVLSNQRMNIYLKDLCELCGFTDIVKKEFFEGGVRKEETYMKWELISTHAARRTFICYALAKGLPPNTIMKWTGHSDYKAMKPYIDIAEKEKENAMNTLEQELINTIYGEEQDEENTEQS